MGPCCIDHFVPRHAIADLLTVSCLMFVSTSISPQLLACCCFFCLIGLTSRIKKQCFRLIRKIPFVGMAVSISNKSLPSFLSRRVLTLSCDALMSHFWMTDCGLQRVGWGCADLWHTWHHALVIILGYFWSLCCQLGTSFQTSSRVCIKSWRFSGRVS